MMNIRISPASSHTDVDLLLGVLEYVERPRPRSLTELYKRLLSRACALTGAEDGALYTFSRTGGRRRLEAVQVRSTALRDRRPDLRMAVDASSISGYVALSGETVREDNVYGIPPDRPYRFNPEFDRLLGIRSRCMLCFCLTDYEGSAIAVVQLANRRDPTTGEIAPFPPEMTEMARLFDRLVRGAVERMTMVDRIRAQNTRLRDRSQKLAEQRARIEELRDQTEEAFLLSISLLARAAEIYDEGTGDHIVRVNEYSYCLAKELGMPASFCDEIRYSAQLHDVGKIAVDTAVLKKTGTLTHADREEMNRHPIYGYEILHPSGRLQMAAEIALHHHEKWDGTGYPRGLKGEQVPISARIVQIADVYDALRSPRHYKGPMSHAEAVGVMLKGDKRIDPQGHFDPHILEVFARCHDRFDEIWRQFADD
ncbi:MAG: HD domain-containing phosphohydrolase [Alphaproteobacteria bacterium]|nr:HD domain-containing phosphohydrolase [Alphaproteobacteria bacterium]